MAKPETNNFTTVEIQIINGVISVDAATNSGETTKPFALTLKKSGDNWIFYDALTNKYINGGGIYKNNKGNLKNNNYFKEVNSVEEGTGTSKYNGIWTISLTTDNFVSIKNQNGFTVYFNHTLNKNVPYNRIASYSTFDKKNYSNVWLYKKLKLETLTPAASGYATYAADYAVNYSEQGLTAYTVKVATDNSKVSATPFTGVVPAGKAVLVKGTAGQEYTLTPATTAADETFDTDLQASDGTVTANGAQHFAFGTKNGVSGFKLVKSGVVIPAKKGYLLISNAGAKEFFAFEGETTGISAVETAPATDGNVYNMAGQRVSKNYKGLVIVGGKKYLNK